MTAWRSTMIDVINISSDTNIGGAGRCILTFLKHYDRDKFNVSVVLPRGSKLEGAVRELDTPVIAAEGIADKSLTTGAVSSLRHIIKEHRPHVVHTHGAMSGRIAAKMCKCGIVYTRHSVFPVSSKISQNPGKWFNGRINEFFSDSIIAVAQAAKDNLTEGGISPERVAVILNGVEAQRPASPRRLAEMRETYKIENRDFVIGILARLEEVKGHELLLEAAAQLKSEDRHLKVIISGTGGIESRLKAQSEQMGLSDTVIFTGFVDNVPEILSLMDLQINASYGTEATSLSLLEGMSLGLPAVVSNYGGNPGVITSGINGLIFPSRDSGALADCIRTAMDDRAMLEHLREGSIDIFEKKFTAERYTEDIEEVYQRVFVKRGMR